MRLTILNVAYPFAPVGPDAVGGAEQVLSQLDGAIARAGWRSLVLACDGSITTGMLFRHKIPAGVLHAQARAAACESYRDHLERIIAEYSVDLVHMHGIDFACYFPRTDVPVLVSLHLPLSWYPVDALQWPCDRVYFNCVSESQRREFPQWRRSVPVIENGVPIHRLDPVECKRDRVFAMGRICPEKGFHHALDAARDAGLPLLLAGHVFQYPEHESYFESEIRPRLDRLRRFIGPVGGRTKTRLLSSSRCLLVTSTVPETSSLVAMEALACGTPVIAFPVGALTEIVEDGVTGFLVTNRREMARAIARAGDIDPARCRARARERFCVERANVGYLELYRKLGRRDREIGRTESEFHGAGIAG